MLEVAGASLGAVARGHPVGSRELQGQLCAQGRLELDWVPTEILPLHALAVRVGGRVEPALGGPHVGFEVGRALLDHAAGEVLTGEGRADARVGVEPEQKPVVVEHFLEVGDLPARVDAVAGEAAAQMVVHAPAPHALERVPQRRRGVGFGVGLRRGVGLGLYLDVGGPAQQLERGDVGKLGGLAKASPRRVDAMDRSPSSLA